MQWEAYTNLYASQMASLRHWGIAPKQSWRVTHRLVAHIWSRSSTEMDDDDADECPPVVCDQGNDAEWASIRRLNEICDILTSKFYFRFSLIFNNILKCWKFCLK